MLFALIYAVVGRLLSLIVVRGRGEASKDVELVLLRHEESTDLGAVPNRRYFNALSRMTACAVS